MNRDEKVRHVLTLRRAALAVKGALGVYNNARELLEVVLQEYNAAVAGAVRFRDEVVREHGQGSDGGDVSPAWVGPWANATFPEAELHLPGGVDVPDLSAADTLESLPDEPGA